MIRITQLKMEIHHSREALLAKISRTLGIRPEAVMEFQIVKQSIDARKKPELYFIYTVDVKTKKEETIVKKCRSASVTIAPAKSYQFPETGTEKLRIAPVIIGCGPAGLFCGWMLAREGYAPVLLERGQDVDQRTRDVEQFWAEGTLNTKSNVQFGEGGAGTFSDGKLNTMVKDSECRNRQVLEMLVGAGADETILYSNKPHVGTDVLRTVVKTLRHQIESMGGTIRFGSQLTDLKIEHGRVTALEINHSEWMEAQCVVLAIGHSARDTFQMLYRRGVHMEAKPFAVGLRMEHPQEMIDRSQYGASHPELGPAPYKVTKQTSTGRGVYSFCMCPGGFVVNASSEEKHLAVNGMSYHRRDSGNANSAIIVTVGPEDFQQAVTSSDLPDALAGMEFQRNLESCAYRLCGGKIPVQLFGDFRENRMTRQFGEVLPCMKGAYAFGNLRELFSPVISQSLVEGVEAFEGMIQGFSRYDAVFSGVESRTSSPVRMERNGVLESNIAGLYPCGEGAGYAGGITSAAMDGLKAAEKIGSRYAPLESQ